MDRQKNRRSCFFSLFLKVSLVVAAACCCCFDIFYIFLYFFVLCTRFVDASVQYNCCWNCCCWNKKLVSCVLKKLSDDSSLRSHALYSDSSPWLLLSCSDFEIIRSNEQAEKV